MPETIRPHISLSGIQEDDDGFVIVACNCGAVLGPAPDEETALDMAMEHAWRAGREVAQ